MDARLHDLIRRARGGDAAGAELELHAWARQDDCPPAARGALAAMLMRRGRPDAALDLLRPVTPAALIVADLTDTARRLTTGLYETHGHLNGVRPWIEAAEAPGAAKLPEVSAAAVEQLATELTDDPDVVRSLVVALKQQRAATGGVARRPQRGAVSPDEHTEATDKPIALLRAAVERVLPGFIDRPRQTVVLYTALAELALLADDRGAARRWAHKGLKVDPYCAALALVLAACEDEPTLGPPARQALARVSRRHPGYPDVRAAMIRRAFAEGRTGAARRRLAAWLRRDPDSPLAHRLREEIAA